jgi:hypothetical protein
VWLKQWSEVNQRYGGNPQVGKYIGIYFAFGVGSAALVVVQTLILWIFCSIEVRISIVGSHMHDRPCIDCLRQAENYTSGWPSRSSALQ